MIKEKINIDLNNKYFCYILGLIWADGHVAKKYNRVTISLVEEDMFSLLNIFENTGYWNIYYSNNEKRNYKNQMRMSISDKDFKNFLVNYNYITKSLDSPDKLISQMPINNLRHFIRGIVDGDGCFYFNKKNYLRQMVITSTHDQNWNYLIQLCNSLNIKYRIDKIKNLKSKSSMFRICNKDIITFGNYIYEDFFGLRRKLDKFNNIVKSYDILNHKQKIGNPTKLTINGIDYKSMVEAAFKLNIHRGTLRRRLLNKYYEIL